MTQLQEMEQKLSKKKKIAKLASCIGIPAGIGVGIVGNAMAKELLIQHHLRANTGYVYDMLQRLILAFEGKYIHPYGIDLPNDPLTFMSNIEKNRAAFGQDYDKVYNFFASRYDNTITDVINYAGVPEQSMAIGLGAGVVSFLLISSIPTAKYLYYRRKYKQLEKQEKSQELEQAV